MSRPAAVALVPLACPACGGNLPALEEDAAFVCPPCRRGFELRGDALAAVPLRIMPKPTAGAAFHLPFWSFGGGIRVPAFNTRELLPLARRFSGRDLEEDGGQAPALVGASLSSPEAWRVAEFASLAPEGTPPPSPALLGVPFLDEGSRLLDLATGVRVYKETIHRAEGLIRAALGAEGQRS